MGEYSKFISEKRRPVPAPERLVDKSGKCVFGTFSEEFRSMDLVSARKPTQAPQFLNKLKLTLWEATEVHLKEGVLLAVVCDMGIFGMTLNTFYDKRTKKAHQWVTNLKSKDTVISPNLIDNNVAAAFTPVSFVKYVNDFSNGRADLSGSHRDDYGAIEYSFKLTRISKPSVVSIPFGDNRPLYSQKDFFKAEGSLTINGEKLTTDDESVAIIDDHRGYYPRHAHYDWVTTMGTNVINGEKKYFAFNLTRNQSVDQDDYNENLIWLEGDARPMPPVCFTRSPESAKANGKSVWYVKDEHGMVDVEFTVHDMTAMITHAVVVNIDYYIAFGELRGYVMDEDGNKYVLDGMMGMGEDKTLLL